VVSAACKYRSFPGCGLQSTENHVDFANSYQWMSRKEIRARYAIKGDAAEDAVWTMCCPVCALVQEEKEVLRRTTGAAPAQNAGYVPETQMQMQPQTQNYTA
jgi:hypothetical protein